MSGRVLALVLVAAAALAAGAMYYLQVYAFYDRLPPQDDFTIATPDGARTVPVSGFRGIDSESSPIRYRACFTIDPAVLESAVGHDDPTPLTAPGWFDCFDAVAIDAALREGQARAYLSQPNVRYGIDRLVAVMPDGRAFAWHQINACGAAHFDGDPVPQGCPPPPSEER